MDRPNQVQQEPFVPKKGLMDSSMVEKWSAKVADVGSPSAKIGNAKLAWLGLPLQEMITRVLICKGQRVAGEGQPQLVTWLVNDEFGDGQ
ncbi:hypothetical protein U1Q18_029650 [Sarracenia purpurea var. burkii]